MKSPLNVKLESVKWGEFNLGDLFEVNTPKRRFDANKVTVLETGRYPYVVRLGSNNGHKGFINENKIHLNEGNTISFGQDTATIYYQEQPYFTGDKIKVLKAKNERFSKNNAQFFISTMMKAFSSFSWGSSSFSVGAIKKQKLNLPISKNGKIDFDFIGAFLSELELEKAETLDSYLLSKGLKEYSLSSKDKSALHKLETTKWDSFRIEDVLDWQMGISELNPLHLDSLSVSNEQKYPFYGQSTSNNGVIEYRNLKDDVLNNKPSKPTILIHSNNQNTVYLETPFYLKDGHGATSVLQSDQLDKMNAQFIIASIKKVI